MRGNAWQITAIIAIILVVVLLVPLVMLGRNHQTLSEQTVQAKKDQSDAAQRAAAAEGETKTMKALLGVPDATVQEMQKQHAEDLGKVLPGETGVTYHDAIAALLEDLAKERESKKQIEEKHAQLESDFNNERSKSKAVEDQVKADLAQSESARDAERKQFMDAKVELDRKLKEAQDQVDKTQNRLASEKNRLESESTQLANANKDIRDTNTNLAAMLEDIRNPNVEHPAGKIISVDQLAGSAIINLGSADGLLVRMMFSVYHSDITGLSFRTAPAGRDPVYCDVCRRDIARDVSKASVEVMRILGPRRAEVRILDDILTDPIMTGDVIYSPIWKPGQKIRFALTAGMRLPGTSDESGNESIKRLIEMNGGIVDCWIDESVEEGDDYLQGSISDLTNFIVINESAARSLEPEVARVQQGLVESAKNRAIKAISLSDLLSRMGWRNMTPVYTFGERVFTPEMRVIPQPQGALPQSNGVVSPAFTPDNTATRVRPREASPVRDSSGDVAPLFNDRAPPPPSSSGRTSDLFRPRSPATGQN
jgi:hypothetical protein